MTGFIPKERDRALSKLTFLQKLTFRTYSNSLLNVEFRRFKSILRDSPGHERLNSDILFYCKNHFPGISRENSRGCDLMLEFNL